MFLPTTKEEMTGLGWDRADVILISGDTYLDSPANGVAVVGHWLAHHGFRVGIIAQPDIATGEDIGRLGEPRLCWGVTGGCLDSMVANYTASGKPRRSDDLTPGGRNDRRPDRAVIAYCNLIRRHFKGTVPLVIGGIEASLRRIAHYDFWTDRVRRSILLDAKADYLLYGMAEGTMLALVRCLAAGASLAGNAGHPREEGDVASVRADLRGLPGLCYAANAPPDGYLQLPSYEVVASDKAAFSEMFRQFSANTEPGAAGLAQRHGERWLVHNPPAAYAEQAELDAVCELDYEHAVHPHYARQGEVSALNTVRFAVTTHRGCFGECSFCAISVHQGRTIRSRSRASILREVAKFSAHPAFRGIIPDVGGPTANMYAWGCRQAEAGASRCTDRRCAWPHPCGNLRSGHAEQVRLLRELRALPGVRKVFVASGIRHDLVMGDREYGAAFLEELVRHHVSGQLKLAPEHTEPQVLALMRKPGNTALLDFKREFDRISRSAGKRQFLTYYFLAAHPGCAEADMARLAAFVRKELHLRPEQVQVFTPTPGTWASVMYHTETDPFTGERIFVEKTVRGRDQQKWGLVEGGRIG
ncbi:MAG: YgiQ family radical SAM protein [Lentisphaeria bacterium]|jgi:uncharacterized radical SAM protein YgiQ|nr:YgiQ family radical SAM protein [Lentisphaeria bacterium]